MDKTKVIPKAKNGAELKRGNSIMIFADPLTEKIPEGMAKLIGFVSEAQYENTETWNVKFEGEDYSYQRRILIHNTGEQNENN